MSIRPYRDIMRRKSRQIMVGIGAGRRRCADHRPVHDQHADRRRRGDHRRRSAGSRRRASTSCASPARTRNRPRRCTRSCKAVEGADRRRHPLPLQARHRGGQGGRRLPAHQSRQHRQRRARARGGARRPRTTAARCASASMPARWRSDLLEKYGEPCPEAMVESALDHAAHPRGPRLPRVQDQREGVRRLPRGRGLSAARRRLRLPAASRHHRGGRRCAPAR